MYKLELSSLSLAAKFFTVSISIQQLTFQMNINLQLLQNVLKPAGA